MPAVEVINLKNGDDVAIARQQRRLVRVGRPSSWGNPFSHLPGEGRFQVRTRDEAIDKFEAWLATQPKLVERAKRELRGKVLGCWCLPERCHAQVWARIVNEAHPGDGKVPPPPPPPDPLELREKAAAESPLSKIALVPESVIASALLGAYDPRAYGARCDECPLKGRHTPVGPSYAANGPGSTKLIIVGEGPGRMEIATGKPFVGPSGQMVNQMLAKAGMSRSECHVTNAAACIDGISMVRMANGRNMRIDRLVKAKSHGPILTVERDGSLGARPITGWHRTPRGGRRTFYVTHEYARANLHGPNRTLMTEDHRVMTASGWVEARALNGQFMATGDAAPTGTSLEVVLGTLLGDASIPAGRSYLQVRHAEGQREYAEMKARVLGAETRRHPSRAARSQSTVAFATASSAFYRKLREEFYPHGEKRIPRRVVESMSDLTLAMWFLDDGYLRDHPVKGLSAEICGAAFTRADMLYAAKCLRRLGFDCKVTPPTRRNRILFGADGARELSRRVATYIPPSMQYKLIAKDRGKFRAHVFATPSMTPFYAKAKVHEVKGRFTTSTVVYCLDVATTHNFVTTAAVVHNCRGDTDGEKERAAACCSARLSNELVALDPAIPVLALGAPAAKVMIGRGGILKTRGLVWKLPEIDPAKIRSAERSLEKRRALGMKKYAAAIDRAEQGLWRSQARAPLAGRTCIPSIHPAYILRGGEAQMPMLRVDVNRAVRAALGGPLKLLDEGPFTVARTADELREQLKTLRTEHVLIDVETLGPDPLVDKMTMLGIAEVPDGTVVQDEYVRVVLASPARETASDRRRLQRVLREMGVVLNEFCKTHVAVGHNFATFDMLVLARYGIKPKRIQDSLVAHHTFASHMRQGLDHLGSMYCDVGPWKVAFKTKGAEEKGGVQSKWMSSDDLDIYNAADVRINAIAWRRMQNDLESEQSVYDKDMNSAAICRSMARSGFAFDQKLADELSAKLKARAGALLGQMRTLLGKPNFHPVRPADLRAALFGQLKIRPLAITATGLASTASGTLETLKSPDTRAGKLAGLILRWRATQKTRSTFIEKIKPHKDGRIHPSWKSFGTVTGRFSCARPNLMNLPRWSRALEDRVRELYIADEGCVLIYFDLSQSEMRMAAYLSGDENFIKSCESGDVHTSNAKILFPDAVELLTRDPKGDYCPRHGEQGDARSECDCGKPFRDVAKNAGFGILYQADSETIFKFLLSKGFSDTTLPDVEAMFAQVHKVYARYYEFCDENWHYCKQHGHLREFFSSRIRWFGWYPSITDTSNYPVQGGIAALMNERLQRIHPQLPRHSHFVAQIHDASITEARGDIQIIEVEKNGKIKKKAMPTGKSAVATWELIKSVWSDKIITPTTGREWVMPIDLKIGKRWSDFG